MKTGEPGDLISVLVPAYNAEATIGETLASAAAQTHRNLEIIVVDDGSTDATPAIVTEAARSDPRIRLLRQPNAGVAAARNRALDEARGTYVAPLDADDIWSTHKLERQFARLRQVPEAGLVYCWSADIDQASYVVERRLDVEAFEGDVYAALVLSNFVGNASVPLIRREIATATEGWDPQLRTDRAQGCEDWKFYLRVAELAPFALEPAFLVGYRQSPGAMSRRIADMLRSYQRVMGDSRQRHPRLPKRLYRWSRAAFDLYLADLLLERSDRLRAAMRLALAVIEDPPVLLLRSFRRRVKRILFQRGEIDPTWRPVAGVHNLEFKNLPPELSSARVDGAWVPSRRASVTRLRTPDFHARNSSARS
jgi:glycosyltransferase involved in cell wall biosynthesis